jgi:hypothetical protein
MHFIPDGSRHHAEFAYPRFVGLVGLPAWNDRLAELSKWRVQNPLYEQFILERHGPEIAFEEIQRFRSQRGRLPFPPEPIHHARLLNLALTVSHVYPRLSAAGRTRLVGYLRTCLKLEYGLGPVIFEMQVACHLMRHGFDVVFHDLENGGGFDFLASKNGSEIEVECKHISADVGRQIHKRKLLDIGIRLLPRFEDTLTGHGELLLATVTLPGRLVNNVHTQDEIVEAVTSAVQSNETVANTSCMVRIERYPIDASHPILMSPDARTEGELKTLFRPLAELDNRSVFFVVKPRQCVGAVLMNSNRPDKVLSKIIERLKDDANRQLTRTRPALLCAHFADLDAEQLKDIAAMPPEQNPINHGVSHLLERRPFLHTVALTATGVVTPERNANGRLVAVGLRDASFTFVNHLHPLANDPNLRGVFKEI